MILGYRAHGWCIIRNEASSGETKKGVVHVGVGREKIQRCYDFFLVFLALLCVVLLILQDRMELSDAQDELIEWLDLGIWIAFAADYCVNLYLAADRRKYVRTHIVELVAILPFNAFFKGIRLMRVYPLIRSTRLLQASRLFRLMKSSRAAATDPPMPPRPFAGQVRRKGLTEGNQSSETPASRIRPRAASSEPSRSIPRQALSLTATSKPSRAASSAE